MSVQEAFERRIPAGEPIKPWLILGPLYEDVSAQVQGLTLFERPGAPVGEAALAQAIEEVYPLLASAPKEGQQAVYRGQTARWELVRRPEKYLSWGTYNISNHLVMALLETNVTADRPEVVTWRLDLGISERILVAVDGQVVYDTAGASRAGARDSYHHTFQAALKEGENRITLAAFRLGRMARVGFLLAAENADLSARVALSMPLEERLAVERELRSLRLDRDVFYPEHSVGLHLVEKAGDARLAVQLMAGDGIAGHEAPPDAEVITRAEVAAPGLIHLADGDGLRDGGYHILCTWLDASGGEITSTAFEIHKVSPMSAMPGHDRLSQRRRVVLEHYAHNEERRPIWTEVARYALARYDLVDEEVIRETCEFIAARKDCADFVIQAILRLLYWERETPHLSPGIVALMKDTVLGFKYWVDEPGDTVMFMGSENHRLLFHVAEFLAGQLYPMDEFSNSRQRGLYHATKGRMYITEWLRQRGRFGFDEWHSNSYYPISMAPLVNVYDFAISEDYKLKQMAGAVIDEMLFNQAADSLEGVLGTTHGRSYGIYVKYPDFEGTSATNWLAFGVGSLTKGTSGMCPVSMASSSYTPPKILGDIATDERAVVESHVRQGLLRGAETSANFVVYRTPDYLMSGLQDHRKGEYESSTHVAQVTLRNKVVVFWSCPHTSGEGSGLRPDYWSGHTTLPRVIQHKNVLSLTWRLTDIAWMTHCWFEQPRFDEVRLDGKWAFGRVGKGYVGIYSQHGYQVGEQGQYAGRELLCVAEENIWLAECGREADWGSFDALVDALRSAEIHETDEALAYASPSIGRFVSGWDVTPTVDGRPIPLKGYPLVESSWAYSAFGSGEMVIRHGDEKYELWLNQ